LVTEDDAEYLATLNPSVAEDEGGIWRVLSRYFVPQESLRKRAERDRVPYDLWAAQGFIEATPGNVVDYGAIEQRILADAALFQIREIAYDPWNATQSRSGSRTKGDDGRVPPGFPLDGGPDP
jgi:phage terminase large subunit-like protein